jgi:hypothetical protein
MWAAQSLASTAFRSFLWLVYAQPGFFPQGINMEELVENFCNKSQVRLLSLLHTL